MRPVKGGEKTEVKVAFFGRIAVLSLLLLLLSRLQGTMAAITMFSSLAPGVAMAPLKGDRMLDGSRDFPWLNLAQVWSANPSVYNTTGDLLTKVDAFLGDGAVCAKNGVSLTRTPVPHDLLKTRAEDVRVLRLTGQGDAKNRTRVMINLGIHGREYITGEVSLRLLAQLCDGTKRSKDLLAETEFMIIPLLNVAGREKVETETSTCASMRKNENDVDLNRNFDFKWEEGSDDPFQEDYRGTAAMSEPQSRLLNYTAAIFAPTMFIDVHSGDQSLMYPYSFKAEECKNAQQHQDMLDFVNAQTFCKAGLPFNDPTQKVFKNTCGVRAGPAALALSPPYTASGTTLDYMYEVLKIPYAMTWEVYSGTRYMQIMQQSKGSALSGATMQHHTQLLDTGAPAYNAVKHRHVEREAPHARTLAAAAHQNPMMPGGARPLPAATPAKPDMSATDCFAYFNPTSEDEMARVAGTWAEALVVGSEFLNNHERGRSALGASATAAVAASKDAVL